MPPPDDAKLDPIARLRQLPMRRRWLRWAVLAFSLAFAAGSSYFFYLGIQEEGHLRFGRTALSVGRDLDARLRAYQDVLYAMRGLFDAADQVTRDDFHEFAEALAIPKRYPGVTNLNFAKRLSGGQKQAFERTVRAEKSRLTEGLPEFSIKPPGERPEYLVLNYIEPLARSAIVWGNDLNADPQRRSALQRARDTGQVASTSGITLQSDAKSPVTSLLFRLAVYHGKGVPNTVEDRQRLYRGMVGSTIRIGEMVEAALPGQTLKRARVIIHEGGEVSGGGTNPDPGALLYDSESGGSAPAATDYSAYAVTQHLSLADRTWRLDIVPLVNPVNPLNQAAVAAVLAVSLAAGALLFWLMTSVATSASRSVELAKTNEALHAENAERKHAEEAVQRSETKFRTLYDSSSDAVMLLDQKGFFDCNPATLAMFGCAIREEFCSKHPADLSPPVQPDGTDSQTLASRRIATAMEKGSIRFEWMHKRADTGETFPADVLLTAMTLDDKPVLQAVLRDITERKRIEADLHRFRAELEQRIAGATTANDSLLRQTEELRRLNAERAALGSMNELLTACASPDEAYEIFGRAAPGLFPSLSGALHIFSASRNQLTPAATWGTWPDAATPAGPESCWGLRRGQYYVGNGTITPPCGHAGPTRGLATLCVPLTAYGEVLGVLHLRGPDASTMQSALQLAAMAGDGLALTLANLRLRESLKAQSIRDPLTDLFNRRYLTETLEREFARAQRSGAPVAVMMLDVDHFKRFNDNFGHDAGDAVLRELGAFFRRSIRTEDIACRYGGEEFCLVLPQMARDGARQRAEAIRAGVARLEIRSGDRVLESVTLSLGVALFPENAKTIATVLAAADASLYQAKREGRNRVVMSAATGTAGVTAAADTSTV